MTTLKKVAAEHEHPSSWKYIQIAFILAVITAAEVALYYLKLPDSVLIATLMGMSAVKFLMVVGYFMHLKYDAPIFKQLFLIGFILAGIVYTIVLLTFGIFR